MFKKRRDRVEPGPLAPDPNGQKQAVRFGVPVPQKLALRVIVVKLRLG